MRRFLIVRSPLLALLLLAFVSRPAMTATAERKTEFVLWITFDGLRWQEVFAGADRRLIDTKVGGVKDVTATEERFWRDTPEARRSTLMPFFWNTIVAEGQVFGDPDQNCIAAVTNKRKFSYPGYNEILTGFADPRITSNAKRHNQNVTVLEWLHNRPGFEGRVAVFGSWEVFPYIINTDRSGLPVNAGWQPVEGVRSTEKTTLLNELARETPHYWETLRYDVYTFYAAQAYLKSHKPRVLYVAFGETDDWCHDGRYDLYLDAAQRTDRYIERLWETAQSMPEYAGRTSLVMTTDHGRGDSREGWKSHGPHIPGSERIWIAVLGPDTPADGLRAELEVGQNQVAATVAQLLGEDYHAAVPKSGEVLPGVNAAVAP